MVCFSFKECAVDVRGEGFEIFSHRPGRHHGQIGKLTVGVAGISPQCADFRIAFFVPPADEFKITFFPFRPHSPGPYCGKGQPDIVRQVKGGDLTVGIVGHHVETAGNILFFQPFAHIFDKFPDMIADRLRPLFEIGLASGTTALIKTVIGHHIKESGDQ